MNISATDWLDKALQLDGVTAAAICSPDGAETAKVKEQNTDVAAVEHAVRCAADVFAVLRFQKIQTQWLKFEFEKAHFYCITNADGHCLGFFVSKDGQPHPTNQLEQFIAEFAESKNVHLTNKA